MVCPRCKASALIAIKTWHEPKGVTARYRECRACGCRVKSRESIFAVVKQHATEQGDPAAVDL